MADIYVLGRDTTETQRLNQQHVLFTKNMGYLIHPSIAKMLPEKPRIAEMATGTGVWALDVLDTFPKADIHCSDYSAEQFPAKGSYPSNLTFSTANVKETFPAELRGSFDLINVRAIIGAMDVGEWEPVAKNLFSLLKPGGALQWTETDLSRTRVFRGTEPDAKPKNLRNLVKTFQLAMGEKIRFEESTLAEAFASAGCKDIEVDITASDLSMDTRRALSENYSTALLEWAKKQDSLLIDPKAWSSAMAQTQNGKLSRAIASTKRALQSSKHRVAKQRKAKLAQQQKLMKNRPAEPNGVVDMETAISLEIAKGSYIQSEVFTTIGWKR